MQERSPFYSRRSRREKCFRFSYQWSLCSGERALRKSANTNFLEPFAGCCRLNLPGDADSLPRTGGHASHGTREMAGEEPLCL